MYYSEPIQLEYNFITRSCETRCQLPTHLISKCAYFLHAFECSLVGEDAEHSTSSLSAHIAAMVCVLWHCGWFLLFFLFICNVPSDFWFRAWSVIKSVARLQMTISVRFKNRTRKKEKPQIEEKNLFQQKKIENNPKKEAGGFWQTRIVYGKLFARVSSTGNNVCVWERATVTETGQRGD